MPIKVGIKIVAGQKKPKTKNFTCQILQISAKSTLLLVRVETIKESGQRDVSDNVL